MDQPPVPITDYTAPKLELDGFHCPHPTCGVFSRQRWFRSARFFSDARLGGNDHIDTRFLLAVCDRCGDVSIWRDDKMIFPTSSPAAKPHKSTPPEILGDVHEARAIVTTSPRGAAALLRLATEKLAALLVEKPGRPSGKDLNDNIHILVTDGLPKSIQQALDSLRVIGNEAVHPGQLDLKDDQETALRLFRLINVIVENRIAEPAEIALLYDSKVSGAKKDQIEKRDGNP
jgi:hypothetical protein